jgi:phospholipid/cholesterol/gamma-HCH transport system ATP-binding protein
MAADTLVDIRNLEFAYGARQILTGISMTMKRGQVVAIMGGSGCGKTTLLKLISGTLRPSSGEVVVNGEVIDGRAQPLIIYSERRGEKDVAS